MGQLLTSRDSPAALCANSSTVNQASPHALSHHLEAALCPDCLLHLKTCTAASP
jgi:hypothetical protein